MINGAHVILYGQDAEADRAFIRTARGASRSPSEQRWGRLTAVRLPSGAELPLYEPRHPVAPQSVTLERPRPGATGCAEGTAPSR